MVTSLYYSVILFCPIFFIFEKANCFEILSKKAPETTVLADQILNAVLNNSYNILNRPSPEQVDNNLSDLLPTKVFLELYLRNVNFVDDISQEIGIHVTLRLKWSDTRLRFDENIINGTKIPKYIVLPDHSKIWYPDLFIRNEMKGRIHNILKPNILTRIYSNGTILFSIRLSLELSCPMNLAWYPFDRHDCSIFFASYSYNNREVTILWDPDFPITIEKDGLQVAKFKLENISNWNSNSGELSLGNNNNYDFVITSLKFRREISYYLVNIYFPCMSTVYVSCISFWLGVEALDARVTLGITTVLSMATQTFSFNQIIPGVSYMKAVDIFTGVSIGFVALTLMEYAFVYNIFKSEDTNSKTPAKICPCSNHFIKSKGQIDKSYDAKSRARKIDNICKFALPGVYTIIVLFYFLVCYTH